MFRRWAFFSLLNFGVLAAVGVLLRYKIILPLPGVHQKNLLHGHSHFAFSGWVGMALFTGIAWVLYRYHRGIDLKRYQRIFRLGQISAWGMLLTFPFMGYRWPSIAFSTLSVIFSYAFAIRVWKDTRIAGLPGPLRRWFRAAVVFLVLSTLGTFMLAWLMMQKGVSQEWYIGSVYFFLHFQYNGWFLFAILGFFHFFLYGLPVQGADVDRPELFRYLAWATIPAFFLSALWMRLPAWMYGLAVLAALLQLLALVYLAKTIGNGARGSGARVSVFVRWLWGFALLAFVLKILMQALSVIPSITHFAFGFRPVVIGYLHLVLLGMVSFFLLGFFVHEKLISLEKPLARAGMVLFIVAVVGMETVLMAQGLFSVWYRSLPLANPVLFIFSIGIFAGLLGMLLSQDRGVSAHNPR